MRETDSTRGAVLLAPPPDEAAVEGCHERVVPLVVTGDEGVRFKGAGPADGDEPVVADTGGEDVPANA